MNEYLPALIEFVRPEKTPLTILDLGRNGGKFADSVAKSADTLTYCGPLIGRRSRHNSYREHVSDVNIPSFDLVVFDGSLCRIELHDRLLLLLNLRNYNIPVIAKVHELANIEHCPKDKARYALRGCPYLRLALWKDDCAYFIFCGDDNSTIEEWERLSPGALR